MNNVCYLHNCEATIYKDNVLIDNACTSYNVCRNNDVVFKSFNCRNNTCCNGYKKIHFYIKNCTGKNIKNTQLKITIFANNENYCYLLDLNQINPGESLCVSKEVNLGCLKCFTKGKVLSELISSNDVIAKSCMYI